MKILHRWTVSHAALAVILLALGCWGIHALRFFGNADYLKRTLTLESPVYAALADDGGLCIIDRGQRRLLRTGADGRLLFAANGASRSEEGFYYALQAIPGPDESTIVLNSIPDERGMFHVAEEIVLYDSAGRRQALLYRSENPGDSQDHTLLRHGRLRSLSFADGVLRWFECRPEGLVAKQWTAADGRVTTLETFAVPAANWDVAFAAWLDAETVVYSHKDGSLYAIRAGGAPEVYYYFRTPDSKPGEVVGDGRGGIVFADMMRREIRSGNPGKGWLPILAAGAENFHFYRVAVNSAGEAATCHDLAVLTTTGARVEQVPVTWACHLALAGLIVAWGVVIGAGLYLFIWVYLHTVGATVPRIVLLFLALVILMGGAATIVGSALIHEFSRRSEERTLQHIEQLIRTVRSALNPDQIMALTSSQDYMNEDYRQLRSRLDGMFSLDAKAEGFYYVLSRVQDGQFYGLMWQEASIGLFHPFNFYSPDFPDTSFRRAQAGEICTTRVEDVTGSWLLGVGPVYNHQGDVVALLEVGTDNYHFMNHNRKLIWRIVWQTVTVLAMVSLVLLEGLYLYELIRRRKNLLHNPALKDESFSATYFVRPMIFLYFTASSMPLTFVPLMMKDFYRPFAGLSEEMAVALPLSFNMLCFGLANLLAGHWITRRNFRTIIYTGLSLSVIGFIASGIADGMVGFTLARGLVGIGNGFAFIGMRSILLMEEDPARKDTGYAHFYAGMTAGVNVGLFLGAVLAERWSYAATFYFSALVILLVILLEMRFLHPIFAELARRRESFAVGKRVTARQPWWKLLTDLHAMAFILLDVIPCYAVAAFILYFFPLYAEANGASTEDCGRWMLFAGVLTILFGPALTRALSQAFGTRRGMYFAFSVWSGTLLIFALTGNWLGAVITLLALGLADGFATPFCNNYFLTLEASKKLGEERAVSYFEVAGKIGDTLGPVIFAFALSFGQTRGIGWLAVCCLSFVVLLYSIDRIYHSRKGSS